jgi:hypothetical protein
MNRFQGIDSASLCSYVAYSVPSLLECSKIPAERIMNEMCECFFVPDSDNLTWHFLGKFKIALRCFLDDLG